ncbi:predicted protein [Histoplasma capsulatum var. duboisii H88]|uniref:Predicted protein n=1 Tax=Ajellomyces capsulatus (strain H88) TaxID=544711 RepID=F0UQP0_AJEC8|nr:predicted protein [Histoplasma capsulatum var. duboisii H88]
MASINWHHQDRPKDVQRGMCNVVVNSKVKVGASHIHQFLPILPQTYALLCCIVQTILNFCQRRAGNGTHRQSAFVANVGGKDDLRNWDISVIFHKAHGDFLRGTNSVSGLEDDLVVAVEDLDIASS